MKYIVTLNGKKYEVEVEKGQATAVYAGEAAVAPAAAPAAPAPSASGGTYTGEVALIGCDEKTAAMVMAIVSYETGIPLDQLIFHKIKAL